MNRSSRVPLAGLAVCLVTLGACQKQPPATAAQAAPIRVAGPPATAVAPPPAAAAPHDTQADVLSQDLETINRKGYLSDAYFDYDEASLRMDARTDLDRDAQWLKRFPSVQILLEGHCDDRGTEAYNLALGEQRATAARDYLISLGVAESRIRTISYGKERPFCETPTDNCWQENRRDHVVVTAR
jgi:peptidoglycan-associated lipoprotein